MQYLKQSTAVDVPIGPFLDETDGKTAETALTISQADVRLKKGAGNWAQKNDSNAATHEEFGNYECALDATDTNTVGRLRLHVHESGALPVFENYFVLPANVYDAIVGTDYLQVDAMQVEGGDASDAIQAGGNAAIVANNLDHLMAVALAGGEIVNNSALAKLASKSATAAWADFVNTTDSFQAIRDELAALLTTAMTESYAADGATVTPAQALYMILQKLIECSFTGTAGTVKKRDGATTAFTTVLNSATNPTSISQS